MIALPSVCFVAKVTSPLYEDGIPPFVFASELNTSHALSATQSASSHSALVHLVLTHESRDYGKLLTAIAFFVKCSVFHCSIIY